MPDRSQTSAIARRPRPLCPHCPSHFSLSSHTTLPTACTPTSLTSPPVPSLPSPQLALRFATATLPTLTRAGTLAACANATSLSALLADVVSSLTPDDRNFWCQMMDSLALRVPAGDVNYSVAIAPALLGLSELTYARHCAVLRGKRRTKCANCTRGAAEFSWVDEEDDDDDEEEDDDAAQMPGVESSGKMGVASFENYVCDVLDAEGRKDFIKERFYGGGEIDTRWLLGCFGAILGMSQQEMTQYRGEAERASAWWEEDAEDFEEEEYMSGVSDVESIGRSESARYRW